MADRKISDLTALTAPAAGDYLPIVDISEASAANKNKRITIEELLRGAPDGTAAAPSIGFESDPNTGIYSPGADQLAISTNGVGRLFVGSTGQIGISQSSLTTGGFTGGTLRIGHATGQTAGVLFQNTSTATDSSFWYTDGTDSYLGSNNGFFAHFANGTERLRITSAGLVGIGTSAPGFAVDISAPNDTIVRSRTNGNTSAGFIGSTNDGTNNWFFGSRKDSVGGTSGTDRFNLLYDVNAFLTVTTGGNVGIGTSSPLKKTEIRSTPTTADTDGLRVGDGTRYLEFAQTGATYNYMQVGANQNLIYFSGSNLSLSTDGANAITLNTNSLERVRVTSAGLVGIGTTSVTNLLHLRSDSSSNVDHLYLQNRNGGANSGARIAFSNGTVDYSDNRYAYIGAVNTGASESGNHLVFATNAPGAAATEKARIDSSGRLLVGASSARTVGEIVGGVTYNFQPNFQLESPNSSLGISLITNRSADTTGPFITLGKSRGNALGGVTVVQNGDELGNIYFAGADGTDIECIGAAIFAEVDGTPGANDMPGRLVFSTTADGASSPTERMRITNSGNVTIGSDGTTTLFNQTSITGAVIERTGAIQLARSGDQSLLINRITDDGTLVGFYQDGTQEGTISVSGSTVSYNGAHLSRWSQLPSGQERTEILRGSVLSNIDEMCEWGEEDNEQLNRMKVSDIEGDKNVSGVFQGWDDDDDTYTNDFYCAMTGDFIIRIAQGVTVERGDLLMSAGDGTAKPQDDDIIRSKTIAKVTSTNVSCTYEDGSYCVPCVLMAC